MNPTDTWLAAASQLMPPLIGPEGTAERLVLLLHYGIDWETGWVAGYRTTYWEHLLPTRVSEPTWRSPALGVWWSTAADSLGSTPRNPAERLEVVQLLNQPPKPVLKVLRDQAPALALRCRIVSETRKQAKPKW